MLAHIEFGFNRREKISEMSSKVVDSNPYSRLMALKRMGIVENYEKIRQGSCMNKFYDIYYGYNFLLTTEV